MRKIFPVCCASTAPLSAKSMALSATTMIFLIMFFPAPLFSLDHLIRSRQHVRWDCQTDLLRRVQINDEFEFGRLLHREIGGLGALKDFVNVCSRTSVQ